MKPNPQNWRQRAYSRHFGADCPKPSASTPVLMELASRQAASRLPRELLDAWRRDPFVAPSPVDLRTSVALDHAALEAAEGFEAVLLSPVAPLATCSAIAPTSQDRILSPTRSTEVVSDPTNVLALECARRLEPAEGTIRLCTLHQVLRAQALPNAPGFTQHFRLFALASAGKAGPDDQFERQEFVRHAGVHLSLFEAAEARGYRLASPRGTLFTTPAARVAAERVAKALREAFPALVVQVDELKSDYYDGLRFLFGATASDGTYLPIADVGRFDWVAQLANNRRMRFVASACGIQLIPLRFAL